MAVFGAVLLVLGFVTIALLYGLTVSIVYHLIFGLAVGALARLVLPGRENVGLLGTALIGMGGSMGGAVIANALHVGGLLQFGIGVGVAAALLTVLGLRAR